jgi:hypothetical protein
MILEAAVAPAQPGTVRLHVLLPANWEAPTSAHTPQLIQCRSAVVLGLIGYWVFGFSRPSTQSVVLGHLQHPNSATAIMA